MSTDLVALAEVEGALEWCSEQAEGIMFTTAGCASSEGDPSGVLQYVNSMASDISVNLSMALESLKALAEGRTS